MPPFVTITAFDATAAAAVSCSPLRKKQFLPPAGQMNIGYSSLFPSNVVDRSILCTSVRNRGLRIIRLKASRLSRSETSSSAPSDM